MNIDIRLLTQPGIHERACAPQSPASAPLSDQQVGTTDGFENAVESDSTVKKPELPKSPPGLKTLWREVESLGIWQSLAPLNTPLASALSVAAVEDLKQLFSQLETRGFSFSLITNPNQPRQWGSTPMKRENLQEALLTNSYGDNILGRLAVTMEKPGKDDIAAHPPDMLSGREPGPPIKEAKVQNFEDLKNLETLVLNGEPGDLKNPLLAARLKQFEECGAEFCILEEEGRDGYAISGALKNDFSRPVGLYGAYRALAGDEVDRKSLWIRAPQGGLYPLQSQDDLDTAGFFLLRDVVPRLSADPLARRLRDLGSVGITFFRGDSFVPEGPLSMYHALSELGYSKIGMSLGRVAREDQDIHRGMLPAPSRHLLELGDYYGRNILPRVEKGEISKDEGVFYLHGLNRANEQHPFPESFQSIEQMRAFEHELHPDLKGEGLTRTAVVSFNSVMNALGDESLENVTRDFQQMRRQGVAPQVASDAIVYFREKLRPRSFDEADFTAERSQLMEIASFATSFGDVPKARQALQIEVPEPCADRLEALRILNEIQLRQPRDWNSKTTALQDAVQDYLGLLPWPRTSLSQAAILLGNLVEVMAGKVGIEQTRDIYSYLQRGIQRGAFSDDVVATFAREFALAGDVDFSLSVLQPGSIIKEPYIERAEAARLLREGEKGLKPRTLKVEEKDSLFSSQEVDIDEAAEDYRFLLGLPNRSLADDAVTLAALHQRLHTLAPWEERREIFQDYKEGKLGAPGGKDLLDRLDLELALSENLAVTLKVLKGEYAESYEERKALIPVLTEGLTALAGSAEEKKPSQDYTLLLREHCRKHSLASEADALMELHRGMVPQEGWKGSRDIFSRIMKSLRDGPWSELTPKEAVTNFLGTYLVSPDLESALVSLNRSPGGAEAGKEIDMDDDTIMIDGVKLTIRH